jgi:hypothetical protein
MLNVFINVRNIAVFASGFYTGEHAGELSELYHKYVTHMQRLMDQHCIMEFLNLTNFPRIFYKILSL